MAYPAPKDHLKYISAGWRYRSGTLHAAYDYPMPIGTPLYAVQDGVILDCNDGVKNQRPGDPAGSGAPSNWVLLGFTHKGRKATAYYQHLNRGLRVRKGQKVKAGQLLGYSGNSGNTTGPHLHLATGWGWWSEYTRYNYLKNDGKNSIVLFPPSEVYPAPPAPPKPVPPIPEENDDMLIQRYGSTSKMYLLTGNRLTYLTAEDVERTLDTGKAPPLVRMGDSTWAKFSKGFTIID